MTPRTSAFVLALALCLSASTVKAQTEPATAPVEPAHAAPDDDSVGVVAGPEEVVRALVEAAKAGDEAAYKSHLSPRFIEAVGRLQEASGDGSYSWASFLASSRIDIVEVTPVVFYGRASVRVLTADGRSLKFGLALEGDRWLFALPAHLAERVAALDAPIPVEDASTTEAVATEPSAPPAEAAADEGARRDDALEPNGNGMLDFVAYGKPGHYLLYVPDWIAVVASLGFVAVGGLERVPPPWIAIGPDYSLDSPDVPALLDPRLDGMIGQPYLSDKVSVLTLVGAGATGMLGLAALDVARHQSMHHTHAFVLGALTAGLATYDVTEVLKSSVGRLRPDFRERYLSAACGGYVEAPSTLDCDTLAPEGLSLNRRDVIDGMRSFPSGHSSVAFALATYATMYLGSEYVWGENAIAWAMPLAALAMGGAGATAGFVATSRLADNKHHVEDVAVGAGLGTAIGAASYLLHFDLDGNARVRGFSVSGMPVLGTGGGLVLGGQF